MTLHVDVSARRDGFTVHAAFVAGSRETLALLGPNGAGKSTVVAVLAGLLRPETGRVRLGEEVLDDPQRGLQVPPQDRPVGIVYQDLLLFPHLTALENAAFPLRARGLPAAEARRRARSLLDRLGVGHRARARPSELSGGEAQRVALARALVHEPRLLLLDEPLSALDVRARGEIRALVQRILAGFDGVRLLITHDPVEAMTLADRLVLLEEGRMTQEGTPEEIRATPRTHYAAELVGVNLFAGPLETLEPGAGRIVTPTGAIVVGWPEGIEGAQEAVLGILRPTDVALHVARPEGSARNVLRGRIAAVTVEGDRARVRLATAPALVAEVTLGSLSRLGLEENREIWASFKAVEVEVRLP